MNIVELFVKLNKEVVVFEDRVVVENEVEFSEITVFSDRGRVIVTVDIVLLDEESVVFVVLVFAKVVVLEALVFAKFVVFVAVLVAKVMVLVALVFAKFVVLEG